MESRATDSVGEDAAFGAAPCLPPASVIDGRYEIRRVLGRGGFAVVYLAYDRQLRTEVAIKTLRPDRTSETSLIRLRREVNIAREAASPRLVQVYDIGADGDLWYLTMEVVRGGSLRNLMRREPMRVDRAIRITRGILEALRALHSCGAVHRDLKPENVLIDDGGDPKLADFGLARVVDDHSGLTTITRAVIGTTSYLSPEQALNQTVDARSDLYSLGILLFEMLTGRLPFEGESSFGSVVARLQERAPNVRTFRREVPYWLAGIVAKLLERDSRKRYPSADAVITALDRRRFDIHSVVSVKRIAVAAGAAVVLAAASLLAPVDHQPLNHFARITPAGDHTIVALGSHGETLWHRDTFDLDSPYAMARIRAGEPPVIATVLVRNRDFSPESRQTLTFLKPDTGETVREVKLPSAGREFPDYPDRYHVMSIAAVDLDHDGVDEIIVAYNHMPEAPSYFVLYEPRIDRSRIVFEAMGGHRFAGAEDIDGDGRPELIISGINNGVNWYNALAAVRIHPWVNDTLSDEAAIPKSPDMFNVEDNNLVWYTLMPRGREPEQPSGFQWNGAQRTVTLNYVDRAPVTVSYDGFLTSETAPLSPRDREAFRRAAWFHFCKSRQLLFGGFGSEAVVEAEAAVTSAHDARQSILVEVMRCAFAKTLIAVGRTSEGDAIMRELVTASENAPELSYDAGRAFHLRGDIDRAVEWYERGLAAGAPLEVGKSKHEFIQAIVLALGERGEWKRAADETERFRRGYLKVRSDWTAMYREFIRWRTGKTPELEDIEATLGSTDLLRYWVLEFRNARGEDPLTLLPEVEREISWGAEPLGPLWSLKAELLIRSGHPDEGAAAIRHAWDIASADATRNLIARGHLPLIRERLRRYSKDGSG